MLKAKSILLPIIFNLLFFCSVQAEVITLKSGKVIDGEIVERTKDYIRVKYNGLKIYYENKYIKSIDNQQPDVTAAVRQKEKIAEEGPASFKSGIEFAAAGNFNAARQEFEKQLNDIKGGLNILDALEKGSISKDYAIYLFQGSLHLINEEYNLAIVSLEKAWEINPKDPDVNYNLGSAYFSLGEYNKSIVYLYATLKLLPDDIEAYELIAKDYYNIGDNQKAKDNLLAAKELFKKNGDENGVAHISELLHSVTAITP